MQDNNRMGNEQSGRMETVAEEVEGEQGVAESQDDGETGGENNTEEVQSAEDGKQDQGAVTENTAAEANTDGDSNVPPPANSSPWSSSASSESIDLYAIPQHVPGSSSSSNGIPGPLRGIVQPPTTEGPDRPPSSPPANEAQAEEGEFSDESSIFSRVPNTAPFPSNGRKYLTLKELGLDTPPPLPDTSHVSEGSARPRTPSRGATKVSSPLAPAAGTPERIDRLRRRTRSQNPSPESKRKPKQARALRELPPPEGSSPQGRRQKSNRRKGKEREQDPGLDDFPMLPPPTPSKISTTPPGKGFVPGCGSYSSGLSGRGSIGEAKQGTGYVTQKALPGGMANEISRIGRELSRSLSQMGEGSAPTATNTDGRAFFSKSTGTLQAGGQGEVRSGPGARVRSSWDPPAGSGWGSAVGLGSQNALDPGFAWGAGQARGPGTGRPTNTQIRPEPVAGPSISPSKRKQSKRSGQAQVSNPHPASESGLDDDEEQSYSEGPVQGSQARHEDLESLPDYEDEEEGESQVTAIWDPQLPALRAPIGHPEPTWRNASAVLKGARIKRSPPTERATGMRQQSDNARNPSLGRPILDPQYPVLFPRQTYESGPAQPSPDLEDPFVDQEGDSTPAGDGVSTFVAELLATDSQHKQGNKTGSRKRVQNKSPTSSDPNASIQAGVQQQFPSPSPAGREYRTRAAERAKQAKEQSRHLREELARANEAGIPVGDGAAVVRYHGPRRTSQPNAEGRGNAGRSTHAVRLPFDPVRHHSKDAAPPARRHGNDAAPPSFRGTSRLNLSGDNRGTTPEESQYRHASPYYSRPGPGYKFQEQPEAMIDPALPRGAVRNPTWDDFQHQRDMYMRRLREETVPPYIPDYDNLTTHNQPRAQATDGIGGSHRKGEGRNYSSRGTSNEPLDDPEEGHGEGHKDPANTFTRSSPTPSPIKQPGLLEDVREKVFPRRNLMRRIRTWASEYVRGPKDRMSIRRHSVATQNIVPLPDFPGFSRPGNRVETPDTLFAGPQTDRSQRDRSAPTVEPDDPPRAKRAPKKGESRSPAPKATTSRPKPLKAAPKTKAAKPGASKIGLPKAIAPIAKASYGGALVDPDAGREDEDQGDDEEDEDDDDEDEDESGSEDSEEIHAPSPEPKKEVKSPAMRQRTRAKTKAAEAKSEEGNNLKTAPKKAAETKAAAPKKAAPAKAPTKTTKAKAAPAKTAKKAAPKKTVPAKRAAEPVEDEDDNQPPLKAPKQAKAAKRPAKKPANAKKSTAPTAPQQEQPLIKAAKQQTKKATQAKKAAQPKQASAAKRAADADPPENPPPRKRGRPAKKKE
ncbi:hypothetical protein FQN54_009396 [Arachnomyces sp. PD_36]|nr:hypothetical protein FQN54_009396 [Arachnomyces sp. PD_36]